MSLSLSLSLSLSHFFFSVFWCGIRRCILCAEGRSLRFFHFTLHIIIITRPPSLRFVTKTQLQKKKEKKNNLFIHTTCLFWRSSHPLLCVCFQMIRGVRSAGTPGGPISSLIGRRWMSSTPASTAANNKVRSWIAAVNAEASAPNPKPITSNVDVITASPLRRLLATLSTGPAGAGGAGGAGGSVPDTARQVLQLLTPTGSDGASETTAFGRTIPINWLVPSVHWCYNLSAVRTPDLSADGYTSEHEPPAPFNKRMWAGGSIEWHNDMFVGDTISITSRIKQYV